MAGGYEHAAEARRHWREFLANPSWHHLDRAKWHARKAGAYLMQAEHDAIRAARFDTVTGGEIDPFETCIRDLPGSRP